MDRPTLAFSGAILALIATGFVVAFVALRGPAPQPDLSTPAGVTLAFALAERRGDADAAWDLLAPSVQARTSHDAFRARFPEGTKYEAPLLTTEDEHIDGNSARVVLVQTYPGTTDLFGTTSSSSGRQTVVLTRTTDTNAWRITIPPDGWLLAAR
jgi:hypothetical protein